VNDAYKNEMERVAKRLRALVNKVPVAEIRDVVRGLGFALSAHDSTDDVWPDLEAAREVEKAANGLRDNLYALMFDVERKARKSK